MKIHLWGAAMSLFDRMIDPARVGPDEPKIPVHQFTSQVQWVGDHLNVGGGIGIVDVPEFRQGWRNFIEDNGGTWRAADDTEVDAIFTQQNTAKTNGTYIDWMRAFHTLMMGMENVTAANKISKSEANQYLQSIANGTVDRSEVSLTASL